MNFPELVQTVLIYALPVLFAITLHEAAHGYAARHFGDNTAFGYLPERCPWSVAQLLDGDIAELWGALAPRPQ